MADGQADTNVLPPSPRSPSSLRGPTVYSEDETLAILEAESAGKPHPFPDRAGSRHAPIEPAQWEAEAEDGKGAQLTFWADDKRAMPTQFIASALFSVVQPKDAGYLNGVVLASGQ